MSSSRAIVVAGMHRSGTSMIAGLLLQAGVNMGSRLLPAGPGNPRGHFEDLDFMLFHRRLLMCRGLTPFTLPRGIEVELTPAERDEARALVTARRMPAWGFKDPRSLVVLREWHELLPRPFYVLLYRDPVQVARSLLARGNDPEIVALPALAIDSWCEASRQTLAFHAAHRESCVLWNIGGVAQKLEAHVTVLDRRLGLTRAGSVAAGFHAGELHTGAPLAGWREALPEAAALYDELEGRADVAGGAPPAEVAQGGELLARLRGGVTEERRARAAAAALGGEALARDGAMNESLALREQLDRENRRLRRVLVERDPARIGGLRGHLLRAIARW